MTNFMIYGANGFVGEAIAELAVARGLRPILAGRNEAKVAAVANRLGLPYRAFALDEAAAVEAGLAGLTAVLHCAGPYLYTYQPMIAGCLRQGVHYLDITGEIPVYEGLYAQDGTAQEQGILIMPAVGFDVVPTDCLAVYLKEKLPTATHLTLGFRTKGPAGLPPGTAKTAIELLSYGMRVRRNGQLVQPKQAIKSRQIDFGTGPVNCTRLAWGDVFTAYLSTGIPNIEVYAAFPPAVVQQMKISSYLRPLFSLPFVKNMLKRAVPPGSSKEKLAKTSTSVWGEVVDAAGKRAEARLHGPEAGVIWTAQTALTAVRHVLAGDLKPGFQTPAQLWGADFVLEDEGVVREG